MPASTSRTRSRLLIPIITFAALLIIGVAVWSFSSSSRVQAADDVPVAALPDETSMGIVTLNVHDMTAMRAYYEEAVGLSVLDETAETVTLGLDVPVLRLTAASDGEVEAAISEAGIYHSAILYRDAQTLAAGLSRLATVAPDTYQGASDHAVSIAFYFVDPEGNGLELYIDRPRQEWVWENGEVVMGSAAVDVNDFMEEHFAGSIIAGSQAVMGHAHLKVGDLAEAEAFYADALGFAVTARSDGALFYAAGGYHHHVATNTWMSEGAGMRTNPTGLGEITVVLPDAAAIADVAARLNDAGHDYVHDADTLRVDDPWGNTVRVTTAD